MLKLKCLPISLGDTLELVLLLDGVRVRRPLGSVDDLIRQALSNRLHVAERRSASPLGDKVDGLVDAAHGRHIHGLTAHNTTRPNARRVLTGGRVDDGINELLDGVGVGEEVHDLESVLDDAHGHDLLAVVAAVHHHGAGEPLDDGALRLLEALSLETPRRVRNELGELGLHRDVVLKGDVANLDVIVAPLVEELHLGGVRRGPHFDARLHES
mmetsp:Transcript_4596/g.11581  ORF Transcript_4596/g.11581 Transcript_4596/m.11581 type:complete len:213 (-) Transcript_4596:16-654(-)